MKAVVLGMAKGRVEFRTSKGRSGAGKRTNSELDVLRLIYAVRLLESRGVKTSAYIALLRDDAGRSTKETILKWLTKYEAEGIVEVAERLLTSEETSILRDEKKANALAQACQGGNAIAAVAKCLAEDCLRAHIEAKHPGAMPGIISERPLGINWDAWYVIP